MINRTLFIALLFSWLPICGAAAQFINLNLKIEPELSATVEQNLSFGTQFAGSGQVQVGLGDVNTGIFSIRGYYTQNIFINLNYPDSLYHDNPAIQDAILLDLSMAYNNTGVNDAGTATILDDNNGLVSLYEGVEPEQVWQEVYLYIYGSIDVGNIPDGVYSGDIVLSVEYD